MHTVKDKFKRKNMPNRMLVERVSKIRSLSDEELRGLLKNKEIREKIGIHRKGKREGGQGGGKAGALNFYLTAAGKREIRGTQLADNLKLIVEGKIGELEKNRRIYLSTIAVLKIAGIADPKTGHINKEAIRKCLEANRILHKGEW